MFLTDRIELPYALLALIHYHVISSVVCLFMILQVFYIKSREKHKAFGTYFAITTYQSGLSGLASIVCLHVYFWIRGLELNDSIFALTLSASYGFAALHCITMAVAVQRTQAFPLIAKLFFYGFLVSSPALIIMLIFLKWWPMVFYTTLNFGVNAFCLLRVLKRAQSGDRWTAQKLHGFYSLSTYVYLLQGLFSGAAAKLLFGGNMKLFGFFGWLLPPILIALLYFRWTRAQENIPPETSIR